MFCSNFQILVCLTDVQCIPARNRTLLHTGSVACGSAQRQQLPRLADHWRGARLTKTWPQTIWREHGVTPAGPINWRRGWDSNPRERKRSIGFRVRIGWSRPIPANPERSLFIDVSDNTCPCSSSLKPTYVSTLVCNWFAILANRNTAHGGAPTKPWRSAGRADMAKHLIYSRN